MGKEGVHGSVVQPEHGWRSELTELVSQPFFSSSILHWLWWCKAEVGSHCVCICFLFDLVHETLGQVELQP